MNLHGRLWETRKEVRSSGYYDPIWVLGKEKGKMKGGREGKGRQGKRKEKKRKGETNVLNISGWGGKPE